MERDSSVKTFAGWFQSYTSRRGDTHAHTHLYVSLPLMEMEGKLEANQITQQSTAHNQERKRNEKHS